MRKPLLAIAALLAFIDNGLAQVTSVTNSDGSLTISPTTGAVIGSVNTSHNFTWQGNHYFGSGYPLVDVKAYGAAGDGTTNDTTAINNAFAVAEAIGGILYFPHGRYCANGGLNFTSPTYTTPVHIVGTPGTIIDACNNNVNLFKLGIPYSEVSGLTFVGYNDPSASGATFLFTTNCVQCYADHITALYGAVACLNEGNFNFFSYGACNYSYGAGSGTGNFVNLGSGDNYASIQILHSQFDQGWAVCAPGSSGCIAAPGGPFPARTGSTPYATGAVVSYGNYYLQAVSGGTTGSGTPAVPKYPPSTGVTDGSVVWTLLAPILLNALFIGDNSIDVYLDHDDFTCTCYIPVYVGAISGGAIPNNIDFSSNTVGEQFEIGMYIQNGFAIHVKGTQVNGCLFLSDQCWGMLVTAADTTIDGNYITDSPIGVELTGGGKNIKVTNNDIYSSSLRAIYVHCPETQFIIAQNTVGSSDIAGSSNYPIYVDASSCSYYNVVNNIVHGATNALINSGTAPYTVSGNN